MNRREFLIWVGIGGIASSLPVALAACSSQKDEQTAKSFTNTGKFIKVGTLAQLNQAGILKAKVDGKPVVVIHDPANNSTVEAFNPTCPHKGCIVNWKPGEKVFECPCHGSKFTANGDVVTGPAKKPLTRFQSKLDGDSILVS